MKKLIYQVYVGNRSKLYDWCTDSVRQYAKRIGADYILQTKPILKIAPNPFTTERKDRTGGWKKIGYLPIFEKENAFEHFDKFDQICIVDADIFIRDNAPDVFSYIDRQSDFAGVVEREGPLTEDHKTKIRNYSHMQYGPLHSNKLNFNPNKDGFEFFNMGMMLMNKSITKYLQGQTAKQFVQRAEFWKFVDGIGPWKWSTDQTLLNYWVKNENMKVTKLEWKWNALYTAVKDVKDAHFIHFYLKDKLPNNGEDIEKLKCKL